MGCLQRSTSAGRFPIGQSLRAFENLPLWRCFLCAECAFLVAFNPFLVCPHLSPPLFPLSLRYLVRWCLLNVRNTLPLLVTMFFHTLHLVWFCGIFNCQRLVSVEGLAWRSIVHTQCLARFDQGPLHVRIVADCCGFTLFFKIYFNIF